MKTDTEILNEIISILESDEYPWSDMAEDILCRIRSGGREVNFDE